MKQLLVIITLGLCVSCAGPSKAGKEARANAHQRMDMVNADLAAQQAKQQFEVGQLDTALGTIEAAIARYNKNGHYHLLRGRILLEQHRLDAAFHALHNACEHAPELAEPHYFLGVLHQRWGEDELAIVEYKQASQNDPMHPQYLLATAESYVALNQFEEAINVLTEANKEFQHHPSVSSLLGQIYLTKGDPAEAANWFEDSRLLGNDNNEILTSLITSQFQAGMYAKCLMNMSIFAEENQTLSQTFQRIKGKCLAATGRLIEGRDECLAVTREAPDDAGAWSDLGYIAWEMGDYKRLGRCGEKISQLDSKLAEGLLFEGIAAIHAGNVELANRKLRSMKSDNTFPGVTELLEMYAKNTKLGVETALHLDMDAKTAEGSIEQHFPGLDEGSQPVASVRSDSPDVP